MKNAVFGKPGEIRDKKKNYHTTKFFSETLLAIEMKKKQQQKTKTKQIHMNKSVCLVVSF